MFFTLFYPSTSPKASFALISFLLNLLTTASGNSAPAIKVTLSFVSLEAMFVARFVAAAFWRGCGLLLPNCGLLLLQQVGQQKSAKSLRVSSGLETRSSAFGCRHGFVPEMFTSSSFPHNLVKYKHVHFAYTVNIKPKCQWPGFLCRHVVFSKRELTFTFAICCRPSVCRLSVCRL